LQRVTGLLTESLNGAATARKRVPLSKALYPTRTIILRGCYQRPNLADRGHRVTNATWRSMPHNAKTHLLPEAGAERSEA
jgi:hypothetical protein